MADVIPLSLHEDFSQPVPLIDLVEQYDTIRDDVMEAVQRVFESQRFVLGDEVADFEKDMAEYCDARHAIGCASGTDALILALKSLEIGPGDEVITSPYTFFATASSIARAGAKPVFVDIDPVTYNIDPEQIEAAVTPKTRAIMPVHLFGQCAEMEPIWRIAVRHGLAVVEDACQAIGASYSGRRAGVLGTTGCFSFFPTKNLGGAGDGGLITTDDADLAARMNRLRVHGDVGGYTHLDLGMNSRLDALQAAVLAVKLRHLDSWSAGRNENAQRYQDLFDDAGLTDRVTLPAHKTEGDHVYNQYVVRVHGGHRDEVLQGLRDRNVGCSIYYPKPLHLQDCFADLGYQAGDFPESEKAAAETIALPIYAELGAARQQRVVAEMRSVFEQLDARRSFRRAA